MKRIIKTFGFVLLFTMIFAMSNKVSVKADAFLSKELSAGKNYTKYDVTGDDKPDQLKYTLGKDGYDNYNKITVYVNKKKALTYRLDDYYFYNAVVKVINLDNHKAYLYVYLSSDNGDGPIDLYEYKNGSFVRVLDCTKYFQEAGYHLYANVKSVKGNSITFANSVMSYGLAGCGFDSTFTYKDGKLKKTSCTYAVTDYNRFDSDTYEYETGHPYVTSAYKMQIYSDKKTTKKSFVLASGSKVQITKIYISGKKVSFCMKTKDGKTGWYKSSWDMKQPFTDIMYAG